MVGLHWLRLAVPAIVGWRATKGNQVLRQTSDVLSVVDWFGGIGGVDLW
jgi:hypothetical protein